MGKGVWVVSGRHRARPAQRRAATENFRGAAFLWRSELAGHPRDAAAWQTLEPLRTHGLIENRAALRERVAELLAQVRLASADGGSTAETG